jgi:excisionase family DNA binding protein
MTATRRSNETKPFDPAGSETAQLNSLKRVLENSLRTTLASPGGEEVELPSNLQELLLAAVRQLSAGKTVSLISTERDLTTQEAADLLNVSRPHLVALLEGGQIPFHKTGSHRRVPLTTLLEFASRRDEIRHEALTRLAQMSQDLGMYEP